MKDILFNIPPHSEDEGKYISEAILSHKICGDGQFTRKCSEWMEERFKARRVLLTTSGTAALDMAVMLCGINPGDEVILPSYTFSSTANAAVLRGAKLVFVDIRPDTMNIDEKAIERAITEKTRAIIVVHYAGVSCEMDSIKRIASRHKLRIIEDAAQAMMSSYRGDYLGTIGDIGCYSFHETKNFSMGEGGAIVLNRDCDFERAEIIREKGTNRSKYYRGQIDKYTWVDYGDSFLPSELNAAYLYPQLLNADSIISHRKRCWDMYYNGLMGLWQGGLIQLPTIPEGCEHNGHMFYIKTRDIVERTKLIEYLKSMGIMSVFHYIPLHTSPAGKRYGRFSGRDEYTTTEAERLLRLPLHSDLTYDEVNRVVGGVEEFYGSLR